MVPKYWMVHTPGASSERTYGSESDAIEAAKKYATGCPTLTFYVLEVTSAWAANRTTANPKDLN